MTQSQQQIIIPRMSVIEFICRVAFFYHSVIRSDQSSKQGASTSSPSFFLVSFSFSFSVSVSVLVAQRRSIPKLVDSPKSSEKPPKGTRFAKYKVTFFRQKSFCPGRVLGNNSKLATNLVALFVILIKTSKILKLFGDTRLLINCT